jgi:hypothetical protein
MTDNRRDGERDRKRDRGRYREREKSIPTLNGLSAVEVS